MHNSGVNLQAVLGTVLLTGIVLFVLAAVARRDRRYGNRLRLAGMGIGCLLVIGTIVFMGVAAVATFSSCVARC